MPIIGSVSSWISIFGFIKSLYKKGALKERVYFSFSTEVLFQEKELFLLGDEYNSNFWKPIGGVVKSKRIMDEIKDKFKIKPSEIKTRDISKELAFELIGFKKKSDIFKERFLFKDRIKTMRKIVNKHLNIEILKNNLISEISDEFGVSLKSSDFKNELEWTAETKKYENGIMRVHFYNIIQLKIQSAHILLEKQNIKMMEIKARSKKENISDLSYIFNNRTNN